MIMKTKTMKITGILLTLFMLVTMLGVFAITASAADGIAYIDANGDEQVCSTATEVTLTDTTWSSGWYVVTGDVTIDSRINVNGDVHLILADGATLTASAGIGVNSGNSLTIYGQESSTGKLTAAATNFSAGIGGTGINVSSGSIIINGGNITATGGIMAAGIGGGGSGSGTVTINGGMVTATGGSFAADIGGGGGADGGSGTVTINGGTVTAMGSMGVAGIGSGIPSVDHPLSVYGQGYVTINGGNVKASSIRGTVKNADDTELTLVTVTVPGAFDPDKLFIFDQDGAEYTYGTKDMQLIEGKLYLYVPNTVSRIVIDGYDYLLDWSNDAPKLLEDPDGNGIYEDTRGNEYILDQNADGIPEKVTDADNDGIYEDTNGNLYVPDQDGDGNAEIVTDTDGDGIFEDAEGNLYIPDQNADGIAEKVTDNDADGVYEGENGDFYLPDGNGNITKLTDADGDGIYEDASGKKYVTAAAVEKLTQELEKAMEDLEFAISEQVDPVELQNAIDNVQAQINGLNDTYATHDEVEEAINNAMNVLMGEYTRMLGEAIYSLESMIVEKADSATLEAEIKRLEALIKGLDDIYATGEEVAELKAEMQEKLNELNERLAALENRTATFKVENGNLYVRYNENEEWTLLGNVQGEAGSDGSNGKDGQDGKDGTNGSNGADGEDGKDGITPQLRINSESNEWEVSYDNGSTWTSLGVKATGEKGEQGVQGEKGDKGDTGAAGADGKDGVDGKDGANGEDGADGLIVAATVIGSTALASNIALIAYALIKKTRLF